MKNKVAYITLGCKLNYSETSTISRLLEEHGFIRVEQEDMPDMLVINTCSVTKQAESKCRQIIKKVHRQNPDAYIIVVGCYTELRPEEVIEIPGVNLVLGSNEKFRLPEYLKQAQENIKPLDKDIFMSSYSSGDRTRSFLKIQDGCDYYCSYCTVPLARGNSRSDSISHVVETAKEIGSKGIKEIVLTGVNIGDFGRKNGESFLELIQELEQSKNVERIRISSIEPNLLSYEIIDFVSHSKKFLPHFHIPLQSGSDKILQLMKRRYNSALFEERINYIKNKMPHCCIAVDVITGFPAETQEDFETTFSFLEKLPISYLHVFTYSERQHTLAKEMKDSVPNSERTKRSIKLHELSDTLKTKFYTQQIGKFFKVLFESENEKGKMYGFTDNYVKTTTEFNPLIINTIQNVMISSIQSKELMKIKLL